MDFSTVAAVVVGIVGLIALVVLISFFGAWVTALLVNYLIAPSLLLAIFGVAKLTFWKAFALNVLIGWLGIGGSRISSSK